MSADPFQVHSEFLELLNQNLSARMIQRISDFAYLHKDFYNEISVGLLEGFRKTQPLKRLGLFYLIDCLLKDSSKHQFDGYFHKILSSLNEIIDLTLDIQRQGNKVTAVGASANGSGIRKVLHIWKSKEWITEDLFQKITKLLTSIDTKSQLTEDQIWRRMEQDRDRMKRSREESWICAGDSNDEFLVAWKKAKPIQDKDLEQFEKLLVKYQISCGE